MPTLIYVVEDNTSIRELISYTLGSAGFEVQAFATPQAFLLALGQAHPQLILLDVMLDSDLTGTDLIKKLKLDPATAHIPVIFVTSKSQEIDKANGLDLGADDYIPKPFGVLELTARVKAVLRRTQGTPAPAQAITYKDLTLEPKSKQLFRGQTEISLTFKEYELFAHLYSNMGVVISRDRLLDELWGIDFYGERRTVDVHIRSLRQKLGDNADNPRYIKTLRGYGYMLLKQA